MSDKTKILFLNLNMSMPIIEELKEAYSSRNDDYDVVIPDSIEEASVLLDKYKCGLVFFGVIEKDDIQNISKLLKKYKIHLKNSAMKFVCFSSNEGVKLQTFFAKNGCQDMFNPTTAKAKTILFKADKWITPINVANKKRIEEEEYEKEKAERAQRTKEKLESKNQQEKEFSNTLHESNDHSVERESDNIDLSHGEFSKSEPAFTNQIADDYLNLDFEQAKKKSPKKKKMMSLDTYMNKEDIDTYMSSEVDPNIDLSGEYIGSKIEGEENKPDLTGLSVGSKLDEEKVQQEARMEKIMESGSVTVQVKQKTGKDNENDIILMAELVELYEDEVIVKVPLKSIVLKKKTFVDVTLKYRGETVKVITMGVSVDLEEFDDDHELLSVKLDMISSEKYNRFMELFVERQESIVDFLNQAKGN